MSGTLNATQIVRPELHFKDMKDVVLRKNFQNLDDYFKKENQFLGFQFFDVSFDKSQNNFKLKHGLSYVPQDIVMLKVVGTGYVQFNTGLFDTSSLDISVFGACRIRFLVGSYWNQSNPTAGTPSDVTQFFPTQKTQNNVVKIPLTQTQLLSKAYPGSGANLTAQRMGDTFFMIDASASAQAIACLDPSLTIGIPITFKKTDISFNPVTITAKQAAKTSTTLNTVGETLTIISDGVYYNEIYRKTAGVVYTGVNTFAATTTNPKKGTAISVDKYAVYRVGSRAVAQGTYAHTAAGVVGAGTYLMPLPSGIVIDTTNASADSTNLLQNFSSSIGMGRVLNVLTNLGQSALPVLVTIYDKNNLSSILLSTSTANGTNEFAAQTPWNATNFSFAFANYAYSYTAEFPVVGWNE